MQITSEALEPRQVQLTIVVPPKRVDKAMREVAQQYARYEGISGYRPGKVPVQRVASLIGEEALREAAVEQMTEDIVRDAITSEGIEPSAPASVRIKEQDPLTFEVVVPLSPTIDLGDYMSLRVERQEAEPISEDDVEATLERWRDDLATLQTVERPAEADDVVALSLAGHDGEETIYEEEALTLALSDDGAGDANLPPEVIDEIIGLSTGGEHSFSITYPESWPQAELQGHEVAFTATVASVSGRNAPDLDDEFAREVSGLDSIADLRDRLREQLESRNEMDARDAFVTAVVDALVESSDVQYPPTMLDTEVAGMIADLRQRVESQGFKWERWLELQEKDDDAIWAETEGEADARLRRRLVMVRFVEVEGIDVSRPEVDAEVRRLTQALPRAARRGMPSDDEMRRDAGSRILTGRALDRLMAIAAGDAADSDEAPDEPSGESAYASADEAAHEPDDAPDDTTADDSTDEPTDEPS